MIRRKEFSAVKVIQTRRSDQCPIRGNSGQVGDIASHESTADAPRDIRLHSDFR
jgi:hypothetical protein